MLERIPYDRRAAVAYAHQWAYGRNPDFYDYEEIGGDCTNFASQCLYAGTGVMNFDPVYGWFYRDPNDKAPAWTGVEYFFDFITRQTPSPGPFGISTTLSELEPGDLSSSASIRMYLDIWRSGVRHFAGLPVDHR